MADQDSDSSPDEARLELPKLSFRRRKRVAEPVAVTEPAQSPEAPEALRAEDTPTEVIAVQEPEPTPEPEPHPEPTPEPLPEPEPEPLTLQTATAEADDEDRPTEIFGAVEPDESAAHDIEPDPAPRVRRERTVPHVAARVGAGFAGLVSGLVGVVLTAGFEKGCQAIKGTGSCGGVGLLLLVVVLIAMAFVGSALLKAFRIPDALSTSLLGVGLLAVVTLVFLLGVIDRWFMLVVIPLVAAATFVLSWWGTAKFGADDDDREKVDVNT